MSTQGSRLARGILLALAGCAPLAAAPAGAQEATERDTSLEQVVVTAQWREQALQEVPMALQVVGNDLLDDVAAEDLGDLDLFVPGLRVTGDSPSRLRYAIRGIETGDSGVGIDPAVGVYVDGVYSGRSGASLLAFTDVERIEVLKGPQGTLFGRNSAAGAVAVVTRQPVDDFDALLRLRVGEHARRRIEGMVNLPVADTLALRVNGLLNRSDGWVREAGTGRDLWPEDNWAVRAALRWAAGPRTAATVTWSRDEIDQLARPAFGIVPLAPGDAVAPYPPDPATFVDPRGRPVANDVVGNEESRRLDALTLVVEHDFGPLSLTATTAWRAIESLNREDEDGTDRLAAYFDMASVEDDDSWYQELRFSGGGGRLDWVAGASYYAEDARQQVQAHAYTDSIDTLIANVDPRPTPDGTLFGYTSAVLAAAGSPVSLLGATWDETMYDDGELRSAAVFGDAIWQATERLNVTVGLRYTHDAKEFSWRNGPRVAPGLDARLALLEAAGFFDTFPIPPQAYRFDAVFVLPAPLEGRTVRRSDSWDDWSPRLVLDYQLRPELMVFGSLAKGYKAGGYDGVEVGSSFDEEDVWNLEAGFKSVLARVGLAFNASAYWYRYSDRQVLSLTTAADGAGVPLYRVEPRDEEAWGIDAELRWQPYDEVTLYANVAFIDATYRDTVAADGTDLSGQPTGEPELSAAIGASYVWLLGPRGLVDLSGRYGYRSALRCNDESARQGDCQVGPNVEVGEAQGRLDLRLAWKHRDDRWGAAAFVTNLLDEQYVTDVDTLTATTLGTPFAAVSAPRQWGLEVSVSF